jgi:hypothetical protein
MLKLHTISFEAGYGLLPSWQSRSQEVFPLNRSKDNGLFAWFEMPTVHMLTAKSAAGLGADF